MADNNYSLNEVNAFLQVFKALVDPRTTDEGGKNTVVEDDIETILVETSLTSDFEVEDFMKTFEEVLPEGIDLNFNGDLWWLS